MKARTKIFLAVGAVALLLVGRWSAGWGGSAPGEAPDPSIIGPATAARVALWTCPMHPQIKLPDPGDCPVCGMELVPVASGGDEDPRRLVMSPAARQLARIVSAPVVRKSVTRPVRLVGKIDFDETAVRTISAWVAGRLDRLFVDYTGVRVNKGDHLVWLYSPDLLTAQEELLSASERRTATAGEASEFLASSNRRSYQAAREKLILWGLTESQVVEVEERGTAEDHVMLTSPSTGIVIEKFLDEGAYVETGTRIYKVADLSHLWVRLDAYEQDLSWLRHGQSVTFEVEALPGEVFEGDISFIDPVIHERTRTAKVRVNIDNSEGRLKPGMFVRAVTAVRLGAGGVVLDRALAGKWVSPMHPEIVKDGPGQCDVCSMDLVRAEDLGLVSEEPPTTQLPLVVPQSAVLVTGKRAVVYVEVPGADRPTFEGREVVLGPRAGDEYVVLEGLEEGERVVVNGAFRIDSSMQILAKPSMMSLPGDARGPRGPEARLFRASLEPVYDGYLALQSALAADDLAAARRAVTELRPELERPSAAGIPSTHRTLWKEAQEALTAALARASSEASLAGLRAAFAELSTALSSVAREFGYGGPRALSEVFCPMAFDGEGASWIQVGDTISNPYFGASMLRCGEVRRRFGASTPSPGGREQRVHSTPAADSGESGTARVFQAYLEVHASLARDDAAGAREGLEDLLAAVLEAAREEDLDARVEGRLNELHAALAGVADVSEMARLREVFRDVSVQLLAVEELVGNPTASDLRIVHCPMAFDDAGADWIQAGEVVANPYLGASMLRCGAVTRVSEVR